MAEHARTMLLMPDLINFMLTGVKTAELSISSTTQLMDVNTRNWDIELFEKLNIPARIFLPISEPGRIIGETLQELYDETGIKAPVASVCGHDTGSAVMAIPMKKGERSAYISCGTWSLLGVELDSPRTDDEAFRIEYTNEAGFGRTIRFLKNIMGLWIYQEVKRELELSEGKIDYETLDAEILVSKPFERFIDPDAQVFFEKGQMIKRIQNYCESTNQSVPRTRGEILRCVLESLALKYRYAVEQLEKILGYGLPLIRVVGGGCRDVILMSFTAKATGRRVIAGPVEATAIGNTCAQLIAIGEIEDVWEARSLVSDSFETKLYETDDRDGWDDAYEEFKKLIK
jgi:sugar (pentulose or hexulose) kinase